MSVAIDVHYFYGGTHVYVSNAGISTNVQHLRKELSTTKLLSHALHACNGIL